MSGNRHDLLPNVEAKPEIRLVLNLALAAAMPLSLCIECIFGLGSTLRKFFNFQLTEVGIAITIVCFYSLSEYECVKFHFTSANTN